MILVSRNDIALIESEIIVGMMNETCHVADGWTFLEGWRRW